MSSPHRSKRVSAVVALMVLLVVPAAHGQGQMLGWGRNSSGQSSTGVSSLVPYRQVGFGLYHGAALRSDASVACWGYDFHGQCRVPAEIGGVRQVAAGGFHTLACMLDGQVIAWGKNEFGQCLGTDGAGAVITGNAIGQPVRRLGQVVEGVVQVTGGEEFSAAVRGDGSLICWGSNDQGQAAPPSGLGPLAQVDGGSTHAIARRSDGEVVCWGANGRGQSLGTDATGAQIPGTPAGQRVQILGQTLTEVIEVGAGFEYSVALRADGTVVGWGRNDFQQISFPSRLPTIERLSVGWYHVVLVTAERTTRCFGWNALGQCTPPEGLAGVIGVAGGSESSVAVCEDGSLVCWGGNRNGERATPSSLSRIMQLVAGGNHSLALLESGEVRGWGWDYYGQATTPPNLGTVDRVLGGGVHSVARRTDGTVVCWGDNSLGKCLGTGAGGAPITGPVTLVQPVRIFGNVLGGVTQLAAGFDHTIALSTAVVGWGDNSLGQCATPAGLSNVAQLAAGGAHSLALRSNGTVVCWGWNEFGQCLGSTTAGDPITGAASGASVQIRGVPLQGVTQLAAGYDHSVGLRSDGSVVCWGSNDTGQSNPPSSAVGVVGISAGWSYAAALRADGSVVGWGYNRAGQCLGTERSGLPITSAATGAASQWRGSTVKLATTVACGWDHTLVLLPSAESACSNPGGAGRADLRIGGAAWNNAFIWDWSSDASPQVPGSLTSVDLGTYGSVGSDCDAQALELTARSGTSVLVPPSASASAGGHCIRVAGNATLAGRLWLLGVSDGGSTLPLDLDIPVVSAATRSGNFDLIQTAVPPPAGHFLTLVPNLENGQEVLRLQLRPLSGNAELSGTNAGTFDGTAVAAETIDLNHDGFDDLALAIEFGAGQNGLIQVLLFDPATGGLGATSILTTIPPLATCLAVGDLDGDGNKDVVVGIGGSTPSVRVYRDNGNGGLVAGAVIGGLGATPTSVVVIPPPGNSLLPGGASVGVGLSNSKFRIYLETSLQGEFTLAGTPSTVRGGNTGGAGGTDIVTGGSKSASIGLAPSIETGFVQVLRRQSNGQFLPIPAMFITAKPVRMDVADLDGDGLDDIVTANAEPQLPLTGSALPVLSIFRNSSGSFSGGVPYQPEGASRGLSVSLVDADGDGDRDIVSVHRSVGSESEAALLRVDTTGEAGAPISIGQNTVLPSTDPVLSTRGNLDGAGGDDLYLVTGGSGTNLTGGRQARPYLGVASAREGDLDGNGIVDFGDVVMCLLEFGPCVGCPADLDGTGVVDYGDVVMVLLNFG